MRHYIFGIDAAEPYSAALRLADSGYDGVVLGGGERQIEACMKAGLETWLCYGAHAFDGGADIHAEDPFGARADWFGSACPNARENNRRNMENALRTAVRTGVKGVFVDGARFASFASTEGAASFFGCFCPACMERMRAAGLDADSVRRDIGRLSRWLAGAEDDPDALQGSADAWLAFRADCVGSYMRAFSAACHAEKLLSAAFVFAPSLARFVGQTQEALSGLDIAAPMLYRDYPHDEGPACMGHEWRAYRQLTALRGDAADRLFHIAAPKKDAFQPEDVGREVLRARRTESLLLPIIQIEDERIRETAEAVLEAGADGYGEFMYGM